MESSRKIPQTRRFQKLLLLLIGLAIVAPVLLMHRVALSCTSLSDSSATIASPLDALPMKNIPSILHATDVSASPPQSRFLNASAMCQSLASRSAIGLWVDHIDLIHAASRLRKDRKWKLHDLTAEVLHLVTPRLPLSTRTLTRQTANVKELVQKAHSRYEFIHTPKDRRRGPTPQSLKIVVLGGSVTAGVNCISGVSSDIANCAWPVRLEGLINGLAQGQLVQVHVFAIGGSNTKTATALLEYDLLPKNAQNPDIIINAYSTNDMHIDTIKEAAGEGKTLTDKVFDMAQDFVRVALQPRPCQSHPPLLLWLDDYLGNEQRVIIETTGVSTAINVLANYYGFASISYADTVRDLVYGDTHERIFSPDWYKGKQQQFSREIHPGQGMHMSTAWVVAYNLLNLATNYCSLEAWNVIRGEATMSYNHSKIPGLPELKQERQVGSAEEAKPRPKPKGLPPKLSDSLNLRTVSEDWRASSKVVTTKASTEKQCGTKGYKRCPFSWIVGFPVDGNEMELYHNSDDDARLIHEYFAKYVTDFGGWEIIDDTNKGKYGWVPVSGKSGSTMTLEFDKLSQPIHTVTFFIMKSYGPKWDKSTAQVEIASKGSTDKNWKVLASKDLTGYHDKQTSEMYQAPFVLPTGVKAGDSVRIAIAFVQGSTFKIQGMAVCS